jgi:hypothetical protein
MMKRTHTDYVKEFPEYVLSFYGPGEIYDRGFTMQEIKQAIKIRKIHPNLRKMPFDADSFDRELVRDIVLKMRDPNADTEYNV